MWLECHIFPDLYQCQLIDNLREDMANFLLPLARPERSISAQLISMIEGGENIGAALPPVAGPATSFAP